MKSWGGVLRRAGDRGGALHLVREPDDPLEGLLGTHGSADDGEQLLDAELLTQQALLGHDIVPDAHVREPRHGDRLVLGVQRGDRHAVADLVDADDEVLRRVQGMAFTDVVLEPGAVGAGVPGRDEDRIGLVLVEFTGGGVGQPAVLDHPALLELEGADGRGLVGALRLCGVEVIGNHRGMCPSVENWGAL